MAKTPPDIEAKIVVLRAAGYTLPLIASKTGLSVSTVKRVVKRNPSPHQVGHLDLVEEARGALRTEFSSDDAIRGLYTSLLADTLLHIETSREIANEALGKLKATDTKDAALIFRALTAHSTTLKGHVETVKALAPLPEFIDELPTLRFMVLSEEEEAELRRVQREEAELLDVGEN